MRDRLIVPRVEVVTRGVYVFACPVCRHEFRYDDRYEPMCTGPNASADEHVPTVMKLVRIEPRRRIA